MFTKDELIDIAKRARVPALNYTVEKVSYKGYDWNWSVMHEYDSSVPFFQTVFRVAGEGTDHLVAIRTVRTKKGIRFFLSCGDSFMNGEETPAVENEVKENEEKVFQTLLANNRSTNVSLLTLNRRSNFHGTFVDSGRCRFKASYAKDPQRGGCMHVKMVLEKLVNSGELEGFLNIEEAKSHAHFAYLPELDIENLAKIFNTSLESDIEMFAGLDVEKKVPVLLVGEQGSSKTYRAREFAREGGFDFFVEVGGHAGMEAYDFIGGQIPTKDGMEWMDGPLARAFRAASCGKKVCLLVDELYRIPRRERSVFLTSLSGHKGKYYLNTGRPVLSESGVLMGEVIEAPICNISIIATTNVGAGFDVEEDDNALKERWVQIYVETTEESLRKVLGEICGEDKKKLPLIKKLIDFYKAMVNLCSDNLVNFAPTVRTLSRILELSNDGNSPAVLLQKMKLTWVALDLDGRPVKEQSAAVDLCIRNVFGI